MKTHSPSEPILFARIRKYVSGLIPTRRLRTMINELIIVGQKYKFELWRRSNPSKQFKDYFAETLEPNLTKGKHHPTLGGCLVGDEYGASGHGTFKVLLANGLKPDDVCVDYGCGTLRIGIHVINYLAPRAYWGLDVSEYLLEEGRKLIGEQLLGEKKPQLRVISPQSVAEAAASKPKMLFSANVLIHVHPQELPEYLGNIMTMIGFGGAAIVTGKWSSGDCIQFSGRSWAHSIAMIRSILSEKGGELTILNEEDWLLEEVGRPAKRGVLQIVSARGSR
jgi:hypothetical protein